MSRHRSDVWSGIFMLYDRTQIPLFVPSFHCFFTASSLCLPSDQTTSNWRCHVNGRELYRSAWPAQTTGGSYLLTNGIWCWAWAALTGGFYWLKEHDIMAVFFSMPLWQSGWRCREQRHLVTQRCRALLNTWQETSEESGNGQQMEKRSCRRPEECSVYTRHAASLLFLLKCLMSLSSSFSSCIKLWVKCKTLCISREDKREQNRYFLFIKAQKLNLRHS